MQRFSPLPQNWRKLDVESIGVLGCLLSFAYPLYVHLKALSPLLGFTERLFARSLLFHRPAVGRLRLAGLILGCDACIDIPGILRRRLARGWVNSAQQAEDRQHRDRDETNHTKPPKWGERAGAGRQAQAQAQA